MSSGNDQQDIKREKILEASYQRFLHYGYSKTTMNEIAGDLSLSKALLYYYFPDKSQLYVAVMRRLSSEYIELMTKGVAKSSSFGEAFRMQVDTEHEFMVSNYNFFDFFRLNEQNLPDMIWEIISQIHHTQIELLTGAIKLEIAAGTISPIEDIPAVVDLMLDALHGVRVSAMSHKKQSFPRKEHLEEIHQKRLSLIKIFEKGLKS